jgi:penicillin-binding protein 1C
MHAVPTKPDPYLQAYDVDRATGRAVLPACRAGGRDYVRKTFVVLPSAVTAWLTERHRAIPEQPTFADGCSPDTNAAPPAIVSPAEGTTVTLIPGVPAKNQMVALAVSTRAANVSWFVDGALLGTGPSSERMYWLPSLGKHELVVADDAGRKARRTLHVTSAIR